MSFAATLRTNCSLTGDWRTRCEAGESDSVYWHWQKLVVMETLRRIAISSLAVGAFGGVGVVLWLLVAPDEQCRLEMRKSFPESNPAILAETRKRNELVLQKIKEAAETNENVSRKSPWSS